MKLGDVQVDVVEGDARNVMCDAVEKYHATILVLGSHGYGAFKRYNFFFKFFCVYNNLLQTDVSNFSWL